MLKDIVDKGEERVFSCSFSSINPVDIEKNDGNEKSVDTIGDFSMASNAAGHRAMKTDELLAASLNDNNQLGLVRLELETIVQNNGLQSDGCTESPSDGCWSPSKLRSTASTAREKCDTTLYPICCEIDAKLVKTASDPATKVQQLVNVVEEFTAEMDAALPHLIENAQAEVRQMQYILPILRFVHIYLVSRCNAESIGDEVENRWFKQQFWKMLRVHFSLAQCYELV